MLRQEIRVWLIHVFYLFFILFLLHRIFFVSTGFLEKTASCVTYPFLKIHTAIAQSLQQQADHKKSVSLLQSEIDQKTIENTLLKERLSQLEAQQIFIEQSQEIRDFAQRYTDDNKTIARVLLHYTTPQEDIIFIEGGHNKNFVKDDIVVYLNALVGRIMEVHAWYSKVALVTDKRCRVAGIVGKNGEGISCGKNNKEYDFCFVPHYKPVVVGDLVISSGHGLVYPQGFVIGMVKSVTTDLVSHHIELQSYVDVSSISYVYILKKDFRLCAEQNDQQGTE